MSASWKGTEKSYSSSWNKWCGWCDSREVNPILPTIDNVLDFLTDQFQRGLQYSTLNSYRSALSATIPPIAGIPIGQHPLVTRLLQGMFNSRPPGPRYTSIWNVSVVLQYIINNLGDSSTLSFRDLSRKTVTLLALSLAARCSELHLIDTRFISFSESGMRFQISGLTKTRRSGPPRQYFVSRLESNSLLCPVSLTEAYISHTQFLRGEGSLLFLSLRKPHSPVRSATIARWIKSVLQDAGIDTTVFKAHSTRAAATSAAKEKGFSVGDILQTAGWSRSSTFERFYHKPTPSQSEFNIILVSL